jgi:hypothetical protein
VIDTELEAMMQQLDGAKPNLYGGLVTRLIRRCVSHRDRVAANVGDIGKPAVWSCGDAKRIVPTGMAEPTNIFVSLSIGGLHYALRRKLSRSSSGVTVAVPSFPTTTLLA